MSKYCLAFFIIVGWVMLIGQGLATTQGSLPLTQVEREWIAAHPEVSLVPDPQYHPIEFFDDKGLYRGIAADYVALLENRLGLRFKVLHPRDWEQVLEWARSRKADMTTSAAQTLQRSEYLLFTKPYLEFPAVIITKKQVTEGLTLEKLRGMKVGVISGDAVQEFILRNYPGLDFAEVPDIPTGLKKVSFGMIDAFVGDLTTISYHIEKEGITNLRVAGQTEFSYRLSFASRKDWPILHRILEKGLASIGPGERTMIYRRWVHLEPESFLATQKFWRALLGVFGTALLIIAGVVAWNRSLKRQVSQKTGQLRLSEEKYRSILENAVEGMFQTSPEGTFISANTAMARLLGYESPEELKTDPELARKLYVDPRLREDLWRRLRTEGQAVDFEAELVKKDGSRVWVTSNVRGVKDAAGKLLFIEGFISDNTDRKRAEELLKESERRLSTLMGNLPGIAYRCHNNGDWTMEFISEGCQALTGYPSEELIGGSKFSFVDLIHPDDREGVWQQVQKALREKRPFQIEYRIHTVGGEERWVWEQGRGVFTEDDELLAIEGFIIDTSERRKAMETLRQSNRMKTEFVKTVAHEFRTPLTAIQGFSELLLTNETISHKEQGDSIRYIYERSLALGDMVDDMLDVARIEAGAAIALKKSPCSVRDIFSQVEPFLKTLPSRQPLEVNLVEESTLLNVDKDKMVQILENLLSNAFKFSDSEGLVRIEGGAVAEGYRISVVDQGIGMTPDQVDKIFEKFYRADASDTAVAGVGLGMNIVKHIVEGHGGRIWVDSELGRGTTVSFAIPLWQESGDKD